MSGGLSLTKLADPLDLFKGKGDPLGVAKWAQKNPQYAIPIAAMVAAPFTGGLSLGALGAGAGAAELGAGAAAGLGAAELGAGAAAAAPEVIGSGLAGGAAGAMDMFGTAFPSLAGAGGGGAAELASVAATHSPLFYQMGGSAIGAPSTGLMGAFDSLGSAAKTASRGMRAYDTFQQMTQPQQRPRMAVSAQAPQPTQYQPVAGLFGGSTSQQGGMDAAQLMMLKRMGLL